MGAGGYWNGPQSRLHFHISANEGAWGTTDARLFAHAATRQPTLQPTAGVRPRGHAPYCWISTCRPSARRETVHFDPRCVLDSAA